MVRKSMSPIIFTDEDFHAPDLEQDDSMVITAEIARYEVDKVLIDQGSSVNILYWKTFQQMDLFDDLIVPFPEQIVGFPGERVDTRGYVDLRTRLGTDREGDEKKVRYLLVDANTFYNVLMVHPCLNAFGAIVSTPPLDLEVSDRSGVGDDSSSGSKNEKGVLCSRNEVVPSSLPSEGYPVEGSDGRSRSAHKYRRSN